MAGTKYSGFRRLGPVCRAARRAARKLPKVLTLPRFDLYQLPGSDQLVVDVQSDHVSSRLRTRVVAPLLAVEHLGASIVGLNPVLRVNDRDYAFVAQSLATLSKSELGVLIGSVSDYQDEMSRALDILLTGF
jgi:toxin CcdB